MMMSTARPRNRVKEYRLAQGLSQEELARAAGISRAGLSAIEVQRLVPSVSTAIALAKALQTSVECLFEISTSAAVPIWAAEPQKYPCRYWMAEVLGRTVLYPVEASSGMVQRHDGVANAGDNAERSRDAAARTLVIATCDPAATYLAIEYERQTPFRMLVLRRSSRDALEMVRRGLVHAAGIHLAESSGGKGNQAAIERQQFSFALQMLAIAKWDEGIAHSRTTKLRSARQAVNANLRWIGRSEGAGARHCQDEVLGDRRAPRHVASDHADVVASIRSGFADVGICVRLVAEESRLDFFNIRQEDYDLCFPQSTAADPRMKALTDVVRSASLRDTLADLPGYQLRPPEELIVPAFAKR